MSIPHRQKSRLIALAALLGPIGAIWCVKTFVGAGPAHAPAALTPVDQPAAQAPVEPVRIAEQKSADEYLSRWVMPPAVRSPMNHPPAPDEPPPAAPVEQRAPVAATEPPPVVAVSSIFRTAGGAMASINGKIRRVGDPIANGWKVKDVNVQTRTVTLEGPAGATLEVVSRR